MKQTIRFMSIIALSAVVATTIAVFVLYVTNSEAAFISTAFFGGLLLALIMGAFDERERARFDSIKHRMGNYRKAA